MDNQFKSHRHDIEDQLIRDLINSSSSTIQEVEEKTFDPFESHTCKGGLTETWLVPGGYEFWLVFNTEPKRFTWIEYCPYCGYRPPNLRSDWGNNSIKVNPYLEGPFGTSPVSDAYFELS